MPKNHGLTNILVNLSTARSKKFFLSNTVSKILFGRTRQQPTFNFKKYHSRLLVGLVEVMRDVSLKFLD